MFLVGDDQKGEKGQDASGGPRVGRSHQPTTGRRGGSGTLDSPEAPARQGVSLSVVSYRI